MHRIAWVALITLVSLSALANVTNTDEGVPRVATKEAAAPAQGPAYEWRSVADNQSPEPRPRLQPVTNVPPIGQCQDPCLGGSGCTGYEQFNEMYCRTDGSGLTKYCAAAAGRFCMKKDLGDGLATCTTCFYP